MRVKVRRKIDEISAPHNYFQDFFVSKFEKGKKKLINCSDCAAIHFNFFNRFYRIKAVILISYQFKTMRMIICSLLTILDGCIGNRGRPHCWRAFFKLLYVSKNLSELNSAKSKQKQKL